MAAFDNTDKPKNSWWDGTVLAMVLVSLLIAFGFVLLCKMHR